MNKLMSRYKGLFLSFVSMMMIVVCVCSFSFESKAADTYYITYEEPTVSSNQGYVAVLLKNSSNGDTFVNVFFWYIGQTYSSTTPIHQDIGVGLNITSSKVTFTNVPSPSSCFFNLSVISGNSVLQWYNTSTVSSFSFDYSPNGYMILGAVFNGNVLKREGMTLSTFNIVWGSERLELNKLNDIYNQLVQANANDTTMINKINQIYNSVDTVESKLQQLIDLQEDTNTWLEKIWNSIQEFFTPDEEDEEESSKLENESNDKTDKLDDLNEQNKTDKTDIDGASNSVDENIDLESIDNYGKVLAVITENQYILQILLLVFSVALVAYVLFGKK